MRRVQLLYRILDANFNRAREGLRVCEEVSRFVLDDTKLASSFKRLRHSVTKHVLSLPASYSTIVASRDSENDCGRRSFVAGKKKSSVKEVFIRNIKRAEEATRVIEEFSKLIDQKVAAQFQKIRFTIYDLEKKTIAKL